MVNQERHTFFQTLSIRFVDHRPTGLIVALNNVIGT